MSRASAMPAEARQYTLRAPRAGAHPLTAPTAHQVTFAMIELARRTAFFLLIAATLSPFSARAHDIPTNVVVQTWVVPADDTLTVLVRVPLEAMRDVVLPLEGPGYIDIESADEVLRDAAVVWIANPLEIREGGERLAPPELGAVRLSLPSDRSFREFEAALAHLAAPPLPADTELLARQALLDVRLDYPIDNASGEFAIYPDFRRLGLNTTTVIRFLPPGGSERLFEFSDDPGLVHLDPRWHHAFARFVAFGFDHILDGIDHLLFVLCLIVPFRRIRPLVVIVTSFTVAHSLTLASAAFGLTPAVPWFPALIESLIAASIVYMALENIVGSRWERRWLVAFGFGLVHGFGFSFALNETLQFAGGHVLTSLLAFNLGVELGQLMIIVIVVPLLNLLFRSGLPERVGTIILSAILAHSGWHWMSERVSELWAWRVAMPEPGALLADNALQLTLLAATVALVVWGLRTLYRRFIPREET